MAAGVVIRKNRYFDSVFLMQVAQNLQKEPGVRQAAALMGTEKNRLLLVSMGFSEADMAGAGANDLIVALEGSDQDVLAHILDHIDDWLVRKPATAGPVTLRTLEDALARQPHSNLVVLSVPGEYAAREAHRAIEQGLNVFLFSSNVPVEDELALKQAARERGLVVMGPDCGTAIIAGVGIGFANAVRRGPVGVIGPSGTGLQEFTSTVHNCGSGISHAIGTGSRDLSDAIGGITTLQAFDALEADPATSVIGLVSKPPGQATLRRLCDRANRSSKPVVACFLGITGWPDGMEIRFHTARTLDEAAVMSVELATGAAPACARADSKAVRARLTRQRAGMRPEQKYIRGVFAGGTLCYQAQQVMRDGGLMVYSNVPLPGMGKLADPLRSVEHTLVDMGAEFFTDRRPHPMIDPSLRRERILAEARDPEVAVILLDFILGYNAAPDPVGDLIDAVVEAQRIASQRGAHLCVVASVCGTDEDVQSIDYQTRTLEQAGVVVLPSAAQAAVFSRELALSLQGRS